MNHKSFNYIKNIELNITLRVGSTQMLLNDILNLDINSIIKLDKSFFEHLEIFVEDKLIGYGNIVLIDGNYGIQITKLLKNNIQEGFYFC